MKWLYKIVWAAIYLFSLLPFWVLHRISDFLYFAVYKVGGYRTKVVRQNLVNSFPEKTLEEIIQIERKFYSGFCDLIVETLKTISISEKELFNRCVLKTPGVLDALYEKKANIAGVSGHLGNWEWLGISLNHHSKHHMYGVYKPLTNEFFNAMVFKNRSRYGMTLVTVKNLKLLYQEMTQAPFLVAVLADQAPHYYPKAWELTFLGQKSYCVPGPGFMVAENGQVPLWGWTRRVGRSRYEWGIEVMHPVTQESDLSEHDYTQIDRMSEQHKVTKEIAKNGLLVTRDIALRLEKDIRRSPADWLWSHRRWKSRPN